MTIVDYKRVNNGTINIPYFECKCDCGNIIDVEAYRVVSEHTKSCGCYHRDKLKTRDRGEYTFPKNHISQIGKKYGKLTIIDCFRKDNRNYYRCQCDCGQIIETKVAYILRGYTKSCGCNQHSREKIEAVAKKNTKHGLSGTRLYKTHRGMIRRCYNEKDSMYRLYGGRGIKVCDEWLDKDNYEGLIAFYNWAINNGYSDSLSIDRIDVNGNYEPDNCRWVNDSIQDNNKQNTVFLSLTQISDTGKDTTYTFPLRIWAKITGLHPNVIYARLKDVPTKWTVEKLLTTKSRKAKSDDPLSLNIEPYLEYNMPEKYEESIHD